MADMMPPGGPPPGRNVIKEQQSLLNPTDLAVMKQEMNPNMTVRDFLTQMGIDVDGPVTQLEQFAQKQVQNATAMGKMKNMAQAPPVGGPAPAPGPTGPPPGMDKLLAGR